MIPSSESPKSFAKIDKTIPHCYIVKSRALGGIKYQKEGNIVREGIAVPVEMIGNDHFSFPVTLFLPRIY